MGTSTFNFGIRIIIVNISGLLILTGYFVITGYQNYISSSESSLLKELSGIARTLAIHIDGDKHEQLLNRYTELDDITTVEQDADYKSIYEQLAVVQRSNHVETEIYTMVVDSNAAFYFAVTSSNKPYFRHPYLDYPKALNDNYLIGAELPYYHVDNRGTWLSAFAPIKNTKGEVVAIVQVDKEFGNFLVNARKVMLKELVVSLIVFVFLTGMILYLIKKIINQDDTNKEALRKAYVTVESQHRNITDSINYAKNIQMSIVPDDSTIKDTFRDAFIFWKPKDVVSGDVPWLLKKNEHIYVAAVDCTGHGVPGAMMSFVGYLLLDEINAVQDCLPPGVILDRLNKSVVEKLNQNTEFGSQDGMDISLCKIDLAKKEIEFAGANRPLYYISNSELQLIKGNRKAIGGIDYKKREANFTTHKLSLQTDDSIYLFSDGLQDQFGGPGIKEKKYGPKRIRTIIEDNHSKNMDDMGEVFNSDFLNWKGDQEQIDDVLLLGIKF